MQPPLLSSVAQTIQVAIAPVFLLAGIGAMLNVMVGRLARIVDRARQLEDLYHRTTGAEHDRHVTELRIIARRIGVINSAIFLCVASAICVSLVVALLFITEIRHLNLNLVIAGAFVTSMLLLVLGLVLFLIEVRMSLHAINIRKELLEFDSPPKAP